MDPKDLSRAAADVAPGARETLNVWRNGKAMQISAAVGRNSDDAKTASAEGNGGKSPRPRFLLPAGISSRTLAAVDFDPQQRIVSMVTRGFFSGRKPPTDADGRIPPGQYLEQGFPVLSAGPTPRVRTEDWSFTLKHGPRPVKKWTWAEFNALPLSRMTRDIHCVTAWTKFDTSWQGVLVDDILADAGIAPPTAFTLAHSFDGYATNVPAKDLTGGKAMVALLYEGKPITPDHGGPARLLVPHLYFWKSAKWLNGLQFTEHDEPGFWELRGYHIYGDPWREQRYTDDP
jgi:DMSO/TMAO reductase YedYZ molybdopterin-dependent catalytic subunit